MNESDDALKKIWAGTPRGGNPALVLLRDRRTAFEELVQAENRGEVLFALPMAVVTAIFAFKAGDSLIRAGYIVTTATLVAASLIIWLYWRGRSAPKAEMDAREFRTQLLALYDARIRFLKTVLAWYGIPLLTGGGLVLFRLAEKTAPWGYFVLFAFLGTAAIGIWHYTVVRGVRSIQRKKNELTALLSEMEG